MNKSLSDSFVGLYRSLLKDAAAYYPTLHKDFERDILRLETLSSTMGMKVFTLMLPALGKILDSSFQTGRLDFDGAPLSRSINRRTVIPRLFRGFWSQIVEPDGCLKQDIDSNVVHFLRTLLFAGKKYLIECPESATFATVQEYFDVDQALPPPSPSWDGDGSDLFINGRLSLLDSLPINTDLFAGGDAVGDSARLLSVCQSMADRIASMLGEFFPSDARFRHGPGAVSDLRTGGGYKYAFPTWNPRLQWVFPYDVFGVPNSSSGVRLDGSPETARFIEWSSKLVAVPKTQKGPRLIAAEPTCNQWCQQAMRDSLTTAIRRTPIGQSIDFGRQDLSGELALTASRDGSLATIDLSSASDRLSCWVVERMFRSNRSYLQGFIACRTRYLHQTIDKKSPKLYKLRKFASMGSALTFPVQSLTFLMICMAAGMVATGTKWNNWTRLFKSVRVYGDDLIVPVSWVPIVEEMMSLLHLKINRSKTFSRGSFRESCGTDAFAGSIVSPGQVRQFYDEAKPGTLQGVIDSSNNLYKMGLWNAADFLIAPLAGWVRKLIPSVGFESGSFGLQSSMGFSTDAPTRWNEHLHRWECASMRFVSKSSRTQRYEGFENLLQYFTEDPSLNLLMDWESGNFSKPLSVARKGWVAVGH
jgi:hypothetical protein